MLLEVAWAGTEPEQVMGVHVDVVAFHSYPVLHLYVQLPGVTFCVHVPLPVIGEILLEVAFVGIVSEQENGDTTVISKELEAQ